MRVAVIEEASRLFALCGCQSDVVLASGSDAETGAVLLRAAGPDRVLLLAWKLAQTRVGGPAGMSELRVAGLRRAQAQNGGLQDPAKAGLLPAWGLRMISSTLLNPSSRP